MPTYCQVIVAKTEGGLYQSAPQAEGWRVAEDTVREFDGLRSNDDQSLGDIGHLRCNQQGWIALAFKYSS